MFQTYNFVFVKYYVQTTHCSLFLCYIAFMVQIQEDMYAQLAEEKRLRELHEQQLSEQQQLADQQQQQQQHEEAGAPHWNDDEDIDENGIPMWVHRQAEHAEILG